MNLKGATWQKNDKRDLDRSRECIDRADIAADRRHRALSDNDRAILRFRNSRARQTPTQQRR